MPFFAKTPPFLQKRPFKGPCGEKRGVQTPLFCPSGGPLAGSFWLFPPSKGPAKGPFFYPQRARFENPMPPLKAHFLPLRGPFPGCLEAEKARQTPIERPSKAHQTPIERPSKAHQMPIKCPSKAHQMPSKGLIKHPFALPLMSLRCPLDGPLLSL